MDKTKLEKYLLEKKEYFITCGLPYRMWDAVELYIAFGIRPGSFLTAVLCNDLTAAAANADDQNIMLLHKYVKFFYNGAPATSWGSPERCNRWIDRGGLNEGDPV